MRYNADPKFVDVPLDKLLSKDFTSSQLCPKLSMSQARPADVLGNVGPGTIYLATADRWGNMVSLVHSVFGFYGSLIVVPPYGFFLNNRGSGFTLDANHPNVVAPRKRPFITIIAGFVAKNGEPQMAFGNMSGAVQAQAHAQHLVNMIDLGFNGQASGDAARFDHSQSSDTTTLDEYLFNAVAPGLIAKGQRVRSGNDVGGGYQAIIFDRNPDATPPGPNNHSKPVNGVYRGATDSRKDGMAAGF
jgi:gamma-glutamyltranspeptidase/glutathione hydrolase